MGTAWGSACTPSGRITSSRRTAPSASRGGDPSVDRDVRVKLLDATHQPVLTWRFRNAFPAVYRLSPLDASSSDVVEETVELAFDSMDAEA